MDCNQSSNEARSSEYITASPTQECVLPSHQDGPKLESDVSNQGYLGSEPTSQSPAQEHLFSGSQEGQKSSVALAVHRVISHEHDQTEVSVPRSPTFHPANMVSEESPYSPHSDGSGQELREQSPTTGLPDSQRPQIRRENESSGYSWREGNMGQTWDASARDLSSVDDQRAGAEVDYPLNHLKAGHSVLNQGPRENAPGTTSDTQSDGRKVLPPLEMTTLPLPERSGSPQIQQECLPPSGNTSLPSIAEFGHSSQANRWRSRPKHQWCGYLPDIYETQRLELQTADGRPPRLVQGPTHLGPPLKPLDDARAGAVAIDQWSRVMRMREIREAAGQ
ncbi:MAG: hypothetical protein Q9161_005649 [Pseudevernia consocians]